MTGQPIADACVEVQSTDFSFFDATCTDDTGAWTITGVTAGAAYLVDAAADGYAEQVYNGKFDINDCTPVTAPAVVNFRRTHPGDLVGSVHHADGTVPTDLDLNAERVGQADASFSGSADPTTGVFDIAVPAGTYVIDYQSGPFHLYASGRRNAVRPRPSRCKRMVRRRSGP